MSSLIKSSLSTSANKCWRVVVSDIGFTGTHTVETTDGSSIPQTLTATINGQPAAIGSDGLIAGQTVDGDLLCLSRPDNSCSNFIIDSEFSE